MLGGFAVFVAWMGAGAPGVVETFVVSPRVSAVAVVLVPGQSDAKSDTSSILAEFSRAISEDLVIWKEAVQAAGIKPQ